MTNDREALLYILDHYKDFGIKKSEISYKLIYELLCDGVADIGGKRSQQLKSRIDKLVELLVQHNISYKFINIAPKGGREGERIALTDQMCIEEIRLEKLALIDENIKRTLEDFKLDCLYKYGKKKGMKAIEYFDKFLNQEWKLSSEFEEYLNSHVLCRENEEYKYPLEEPSYKIQAESNGVKLSDIYKETLRRYLLHRIHIINGVYKRVQSTPIWLDRRIRALNKNISVPSFKSNKYPEISIEEDNTKVEEFSGLDFIPSGFKCETHSGYCIYKGNRLSYIVQLWIANDKSFQYRLKGKICMATYLKFVHPKSTATSSTLLEACEEAVRWGSFYELEQGKKDEERHN